MAMKDNNNKNEDYDVSTTDILNETIKQQKKAAEILKRAQIYGIIADGKKTHILGRTLFVVLFLLLVFLSGVFVIYFYTDNAGLEVHIPDHECAFDEGIYTPGTCISYGFTTYECIVEDDCDTIEVIYDTTYGPCQYGAAVITEDDINTYYTYTCMVCGKVNVVTVAK